MARRSSRAASSTSSSGVLAPSRKLYAECACSSAYATDERAIRAPGFGSGGWYGPRLRDQGTSSGGPAVAEPPAWRGLPSSTRSISAQLGGPLNQPTFYSLSNICSIDSTSITSMSATAVAGPAVADRPSDLTATAVTT